MKKLFTCLFVLAGLLCAYTSNAYTNAWSLLGNDHVPTKGVQLIHPTSYLVYSLNEQYLKQVLLGLSNNPDEGQIIELPLPDGTFRDFKVWQTPIMPAQLGTKYASIKTFTAQAADDPRVTAKLDFTVFGFHAMIFDGNNTSLINPYSNTADGIYMCHYQRNEVKPIGQRTVCMVKGSKDDSPGGESMQVTGKGTAPQPKIINGIQLRTYRLALACDDQFAIASTGLSTPTKAQVFSQMTTDMNRINGVYERDFSITMTFVANEDTIIYVSSTGDPYFADNLNPDGLLYDNQVMCDSLIGDANYDIGHVFTTGGGGLSYVGIVCQSGQKAGSETGLPNPVGDGFTIDYVAHEMGHEYGGDHPFNNDEDGSCGGNAAQNSAYEPGSGSTIMAYAGICDPDDLQPHSDPYFHAISVQQIVTYTTTQAGNTCPVKTVTGNTIVSLPAFTTSYSIPYKTPFELTAPAATDTVADTLNTYCWEQWNRGDFGKRLDNTFLKGPIFRSFNPDTSATRVFPKLDSILRGTYSYVGNVYEDREGEKVPDTARYLTFKLTVRDIYHGTGAILTPNDTIHLNVINTGVAFTVTNPSATWVAHNTQAITWDVASTTAAPINCDSVYIYLSTDGGHTWSIPLGEYANTGSANITVPNVSASNVRIKVKGANNVFFNVNQSAISIVYASGVAQVNGASNIRVYPVPATDVINVTTDNTSILQTSVSNEMGQIVWKGSINKQGNIPVSKWAKGVYYIQFVDGNGQRTVKSVTVE